MFPDAIFYEYAPPRAAVPITHFPKPSNKIYANAASGTINWATHSNSAYSTKYTNSFIFYGNENKITGLIYSDDGEWAPHSYCTVGEEWDVTEMVSDWYDTSDFYIYFIMKNQDQKKKIGACAVDVYTRAGFLDLAHMEEISHVTNYKDPVGLAFTIDSLYWVENSMFNGTGDLTKNRVVKTESFNVRNKRMGKLSLPIPGSAMKNTTSTAIVTSLAASTIDAVF